MWRGHGVPVGDRVERSAGHSLASLPRTWWFALHWEKLAGIADALQMVGEFGHDVGRNATVRLPACDFGSPSISRPSSIFLG
jgi:hypothetical protein